MTNQEYLINLFLSNRDKKWIPTLDKNQWKDLNDSYGKEEIIEALIQYIKAYGPSPPINPVSRDDMEKCFYRLKKLDWKKVYLPHESVKGRVLEKYDDYGHPYETCGLGVVQMGNSYINVSNYFNQTLRMECDTYGYVSAHERWRTATDLRTPFLALWRMGNDQLNEHSFVVAFRLATYIATQFKPHVAKMIYDSTGAKTVFDASCGWGDRLAGFYCSNAEQYYGCDPNPKTFEMYKWQCLAYEKLLGCPNPRFDEGRDFFSCIGKKEVIIWRSAAEDMYYKRELPTFDCAFTSPPYFSTELYNSGGEHEDEQSWKRYSTYEEWRDGFYLPVNERIFENLNDGGVQIVNIMDPKVKNKRYYASDDLINNLTTKYKDCSFLGQLGMRIMQRPKNVSKQKLLAHFDQIYIEPCWVFGKNRESLIMNQSEGLSKFMT